MCAIIRNPLQRDGTSQQERLAKILLPENVKIDDRSIEEIITFASEYVKLINYYNTSNEIDKDVGWPCFYDNDPCILLALLGSIDTESIEAQYKSFEEKIQQYLAQGQKPVEDGETDPLPGYYDELINLIFSIAWRIQVSCKTLPTGHLLKDEIIALIKSDLHLAIIDNKQQDALIKLIGYDKASAEPVNNYSSFIVTDANNFCLCTKAWQLDQEGYDCIYPDSSFDLASLKALFYIFFIALLHIKEKAKGYFEECIKTNDSHQPHVTLFLTFLYLFRYAVDHLNTLTSSHLLYYFERVLCLHKKAEVPDEVHIIFELAKNFDTYLVEKNALLNAGKDDTSKQMVYALMKEVVVNKAKVEQLKTVYIDAAAEVIHAASIADSKDGKGEKFNKDEQVHWKPLGSPDSPLTEAGFALASPMFFLKEGLRAAMISYKFAAPPPQPDAFHLQYSSEKDWIEIENVYDAIERILIPYPNIKLIYKTFFTDIQNLINSGFIEIKALYAEVNTPGTKLNENITPNNLSDFIKNSDIQTKADSLKTKIQDEINSTGKVTEINKEISVLRNDILAIKQVYVSRADAINNELDFFIIANTTAAPFTPLQTDEKHPGISSGWPIIKTLVKNKYDDIKSLKISGVDIKVAAYGLKNLVVQNDTAILDNSKESPPFTNKPYVGSYFYVGSKEIFQKKLDFVGAQIQWAGRPVDAQGNLIEFANYYTKYLTTINNDSFKVNAELLNGGIFQSIAGGNSQNLFSNNFINDSTLITLGIEEDPQTAPGGNLGSTIKPSSTATSKSSALKSKAITALESFSPGASIQNDFKLSSFPRDPFIPDFTDNNVNVQKGFMRFTLYPQDFLHDEYPLVYTAIVANKKDALVASDLPKVPYTPKLKNTSLTYISSENIVFGPGRYNATIEELYHIAPFGYESVAIEKEETVFLLPQFIKADNPVVPGPRLIKTGKDLLVPIGNDLLFAQGNLYIGLKDALPEQKVNILFQVLDGSGDNRYTPPDIEWSYLINNDWKIFQPFEIQDHTRADESSRKSLLKSGIIEFTLPKAISSAGTTILDPALLWIKACAHEEPLPVDEDLTQSTLRIKALPDLVAIIAQAGIAQFEDHNNSPNHLALPLPATTISKFIDSKAAIKKVSQPFNSFDGRLAENDNQFYRRISERLRHKNRAICIWDYERLVLEQFPGLYKVKCLNHSDLLENKEIAPGFVSISVIPDLRNRNAANKIEPRVPVGMLDDIKAFLKKRTNLFVASPSLTIGKPDYLQIVNPLYEQVKVTCCVRFYEGLDPAYYKYVLNDDLKKFLAPWAFNANAEINFGSAYHKSAILNFIEERIYVDVVLDFSVQHFKDENEIIDYDADWIVPTTSRSILTSYNIINPHTEVYEHEINVASYNQEDPCRDCSGNTANVKALLPVTVRGNK